MILLLTWCLLPGRWFSVRRFMRAIQIVITAPWPRQKKQPKQGLKILCDFCERGYHIHDDRTCLCTVASWCGCTADHMHVHYVDTAT